MPSESTTPNAITSRLYLARTLLARYYAYGGADYRQEVSTVPVTPRNRIREVREDRGIKRSALARLIRKSVKHVLTLENGQTAPSVQCLLDIRDALQCSLDELYPTPRRLAASA